MGMGDYSFSMQMRDTVRKLVRTTIDEVRPRYRYATVTSINRTTRKCAVQYVGETTSVTVNMGAIQPKTTGQTVRVEGIGTDKFITDVMGDPFIPGISTGT